MSILETILEHKRREVDDSRRSVPLEELRRRIQNVAGTRGFARALSAKGMSVIAELKKASPSRGVLVEDFDPVRLARDCERGGARALSVLTDRRFFQGEGGFIREIKEAVGLPIFIVDEYQIAESRDLGADAILLIAKALSPDLLRRLYESARSLGLDALVETHTASEVALANSIGADLIGINNRDLATFEVSLNRSIELGPSVRAGAIAVSESGIQSSADIRALRDAGFGAVLVGEAIMKGGNVTEALRRLIES